MTTIREWLNLQPPRKATYKDCQVIDWTVISERYVLLTLQIPLPVGGTYEEIVSMDTTVEAVGE